MVKQKITEKLQIQIGESSIGRFRMLLPAIVLMIGLRPFLDGFIAVSMISDICFACVFFSGVYALSKEKWPQLCALCLASGVVIMRIAQHVFGLEWLDLLIDIMVWLFLFQMLVMIGRHIKTETEVTAELLMGAISGYLLLGLVWAYAYSFLEFSHPHSFNGSEHFGDKVWAYVYYSFVTLTTVGYGDITAASNQARALSILEAIFGQLYLAILIARLVGLHAAQIQHKKNR